MNKALSVIIVNYRSKNFLNTCLASLYSLYENKVLEVIIFNNDKNEDLADIINKFPQTKILDERTNIGFGSAHNKAEKIAQGKYLLLLNPDTEIISGLERALELFEQNINLGIIGANLTTQTGATQPWIAGVSPGLFDLLKNNCGIIASKRIWESKETLPADWVSGGAMFVRRDVFKKISGFDENFFMYFEDIDFCKRARAIKAEIRYCPAIKIKHVGGGSFKSKKEQKTLYYTSQDYFFQKHFGKNKARLLQLMRKLCCLT